ncbi:hypothetical protein [Pseudomonas syringae]|uniref:hypothetical protein n=1 Tax=Pseudomonas syringae TaxID=317 RepID=UPI000C079D58|nr:hypothetical protein [Pseudomonas syringae]PHN79902.1 hypothetical protein AO071_05030 [Pseudomonas syringae]
MLESTSKFKLKDIIFNDGSFAIASGKWDGIDGVSVACRWHDEGIGYPQTFGKPQWMLMPSGTKVDILDAFNSGSKKVKLSFG